MNTNDRIAATPSTQLPPEVAEELQAELDECLDTIKWCASSVTRDSLQDVKNTNRPAPVVKDVLEAVSILLAQSENRWDRLKQMISKPQFFDKLQRLDFQRSVSKEQFKKLRDKLAHPHFDEELIKTVSVPMVPLAMWCRAIGVYLSKTKYRGGPEIRPVAGAGATPQPRYQGTQEANMATAQASTSLDTTSLRDNYIPQFDGQPQSYVEWRKRINIYYLKMKLQKRTGECCLNLIGSLQGAAWKVVEDFDLKNVEKETAFDTILELLDKAFAYDNRVQMPQDFENFFTHGVRKPGTTMLQFCTEFDEKFRKVQEALYLILGQDHKAAVITDKRPFGRGKGQRAYYVVDESWKDAFYEEELDDQYDYDQVPVESWQEDDSTFDLDAGYFQADDPEEEEGFVAASADWDVDEYDSAYATYLDARRRFADLKLSRGYLPIVALQGDNASQSTSPTRSPSKGKGPRKGKGGKKGKSNSSTVRYPPCPGGKAPDPRARSTAAIHIWNDAPQSVFLTATQYAFSAIFTIELILRFAAFGCSLFCSDEWSWICLDTLIVLTSLVEVVGNVAVAITQDEALANSVLNISGFKAFRIIRVTRILKTLRLVRVFRFVMALRTLVTSIVYTLRSLFWAMALLLLIVFVFAVLLVEAVSDYVQNNPGVLPFEENEAREMLQRVSESAP
eukprot:g24173.t1